MATAEPTTIPAGYFDIAGLDDVTYRELTDRHAWLLDAIASAGPGANHHGVRTAALVLPAVINELDTRARTYAKAAGHPYWCTCGYTCTGLAPFDAHMDAYPPESPDSQAHREVDAPDAAGQPGSGKHNGVPEGYLQQEAERYFADPDVQAGQDGGDGPAR
jgi:hypothetical protein